MNNATRAALSIIAQSKARGNAPAYAIWDEIYNAMPLDITGEQMQRELNAGVAAGYLARRRGVNGDIYLRGNGAKVLRGSIGGKITYARIPIIRKDVLTAAAAEYADKVLTARDIPTDTPPEIVAGVRNEVMEDFMNGMRYALGLKPCDTKKMTCK